MDIGSRMKSYELHSQARLPNDEVMFVRVDGKAFHRWTEKIKAKKPFDGVVHECMRYATVKVAKEIQNFSLAYTQSDEATFMFHTLEPGSKAWFDGKVSKLVSTTASMFTYHFNDHIRGYTGGINGPSVPAYFDSRAFSIPVEDAPNNFVWRQQDWRRNRVQMLGQFHFGHKEMQNKSSIEVWAMLTEIGVKASDLAPWQNFGTFVFKADVDAKLDDPYITWHDYLDYMEVVRFSDLEGYIDYDDTVR